MDELIDLDQCGRYATGISYPMPVKLSSDLRERGEELLDWGRQLADALLEVERLLATDGVAMQDPVENDLAWAAVFDGEHYQIGLYEASEESLALKKQLVSDPENLLESRFALAEQALSITPQDCGVSFGVLDLGLGSDPKRYLHSIRLVDRREVIAWGMHYRYTVSNGELEHVERLHVGCSAPEVFTRDKLSKMGMHENARVVPKESLPGMELPSEAQLMQLYLYPDVPDTLVHWFWTSNSIYELLHNANGFPRKYMKIDNPCEVNGSTQSGKD